MRNQIALLITGCYADLYAGMKALQVAGRTDAHLHVLQMSDDQTDCASAGKKMQSGEVTDLIGLLAWFSEIERIGINFHVFGNEPDKELAEFLRRHDITCLVAGAHDTKSLQQKNKWLQSLQGQLGADKLWFQRSFRVLVTLPWDDVPFSRALQQLGYTERKARRHK